MLSVLPILKRSIMVSTAAILVGGLVPTAAFADDPVVCVAPVSSQNGVHQPVGADAATFTYNCTTNLWENSHFTYDPLTSLYSAKDSDTYTYNPTSGKYDFITWVFSAPLGDYVPITTSVNVPPSGANVIGAPLPPSADTSISGTGTGSNNTFSGSGGGTICNTGTNSNNTISGTGGGNVCGTGTGSNNSIGGSTTNNGNFNNLNNLNVNNTINGQATTGNALVIGNTTAGNATSGNAQDIANIVNMLQSSSNALSGNTLTFVANINGNINGDFLLDPSTLGTIQPASAAAQNNLTLNNQTNASINNNINVGATSGDAAVAANTTGGNATSGSATAIANVVNVINSAINAGKSFVGVVNINGNLNGDILLPQNFFDQLIATNVPTVTIDTTGTNSNNSVNGPSSTNNTSVTNTNNLGATNTVTTAATSGNASVTGNTYAGNATSGSAANSSITAFNLTGSTVIGGNDLLVFVNVSGKWVGMIVNAPAGATAAELGGGITTNTVGGNSNTAVANTTNARINNNITANARSGDASVSDNTTGGSAKTGDAKTAVNLLNIENSHLTLANWFGVLFINVFGTWNGSFGVNTSAGDALAASAPPNPNSTPPVAAQTRVFRFVPKTSGGGNGVTTRAIDGGSPTLPSSSSAVLAAHVTKSSAPTPQLQQSAHRNLWLPILSITLFILFLVLERVSSLSKKR